MITWVAWLEDRPIRRGGGVQVYIRESTAYTFQPDLSNDQC